MKSNLSVGMPIDLVCYERDSLALRMQRRFEHGDPYFTALSRQWSEGVRTVLLNSCPSCRGRAREVDCSKLCKSEPGTR